jgi:hypothetical protein
MSWATCYSASNNIDFNYPPIMADGRNYASWQPESVINKRIQKEEGIQSNWQYRKFLQKNANQIMNYNTQSACYTLGLETHFNSNETPSDNVPFQFKGTFDTSKPGFGYCNSDLKNPYLSREQLNARLIAPSIHYNETNMENGEKK